LRRTRLILVLVLLLPLVSHDARAGGDDPRAQGAKTPEGTAYARTEETAGKRLALEIGVRQMRRAKAEGPDILLVGAIHLADADYYQAVQKLLDAQDLVLYESVLPEGLGEDVGDDDPTRGATTRARLAFLARVLGRLKSDEVSSMRSVADLAEGARTVDGRLAAYVLRAAKDGWGHAIRFFPAPSSAATTRSWRLESLGRDDRPGGEGPDADLVVEAPDADAAFPSEGEAFNLQRRLAHLLGLVYQGDGVDYDRPRWRVSDLSLDELRRAAKKRGADTAGLEDALAGHGLRGTLVRILLSVLGLTNTLSGGRIAAMVKVLLVSTLGKADTADGRLAGLDPALYDAVVLDRNAVVVRDLARLLDGTHPDVHTVAVFYGAAHMPDLERRLREELGYVPGDTTWLTAIDVDLESLPLSPDTLAAFRRTIEERLEKATNGKK